jgi:hypothetical protein
MLEEGSCRKLALPKIQGGHLRFCILDCNARTDLQIAMIFFVSWASLWETRWTFWILYSQTVAQEGQIFCGLGFTMGRFFLNTSAAQNPRWPPGMYVHPCFGFRRITQAHLLRFTCPEIFFLSFRFLSKTYCPRSKVAARWTSWILYSGLFAARTDWQIDLNFFLWVRLH